MTKENLAGRAARLRQQRTAPLVLELDLTDGLAEIRPASRVQAALGRHRPVLADVLDGLRRAAADPRVRVLVVKVGGRPIGLASVQELRTAVIAFRAAGKVAMAWAETFGEFSGGTVPYYLATAFSPVCLQPSGDLGLTGLAVERVFMREALDRLGVRFEVDKRYEYKSAAEQVTERGFSGPAREESERLITSAVEQVSAAVAERASIPLPQATDLVSGGPYLASQALAAGLVDILGYRDEVMARARETAGEGAVLLYLSRYQRSRALAHRARGAAMPRKPGVALIYATGPIRRGRSGRGAMGPAMGSDTIAAAIRTAAADGLTRAIVLRVNSPGGSYVASDTIWREIVRAREAGLPVVAAMGDVAASGGYYIAMPADAIFAQPGTITGSIGVLTGKPALGEMLGRAGITSDSVSTGGNAGMFSVQRPFTDSERELVSRWLDHIYEDFTGKVADGRGMPRDRVHELARGRVWTGADARDRGLVDELGGLEQAIGDARRRAGLPEAAPVRTYPQPRPGGRLLPPASSDSPAAAQASVLAEVMAESWGPAGALAARLGWPASGPLLLPGNWTLR